MYRFGLTLIRSAVFSSSAAISFLASHPLIHVYFFLYGHGLTFNILGLHRVVLAACSSCLEPARAKSFLKLEQDGGKPPTAKANQINIPFEDGLRGSHLPDFSP